MIHVENVTKYYKDFCAVDQISFEINKGEILGLLGPNGAGKTTTLRMVTGFIRPTSGTIQVKGLDFEDNGLKIKRLIGYLPESAPLYRDMLVYDYLTFIADIGQIKGDRKLSRIRRLTNICGLDEVMHKSIGELSKGYKQRVGLAHAMMNDPEILILDEPTSGLDPNQIVEIRNIIREIGREKTVVLSTHILSEVEATCDRIIIVNRGKIVADDRTSELKQSAKGEWYIHITFKNGDPDAARAELGSIPGVRAVSQTDGEQGALKLRLTCAASEDLMEKVYGKIKQSDWVLLDFHREGRTLENIFREFTRED